MRNRILWTSLTIMLIVGTLLGMVALPALAQGDPFLVTATPQASPTNNGGNATWTLGEPQFASNYPNGFSFNIEATSSAGKLVTATVFWRHSPVSTRTRRIATVAEDGKTATGEWVRSPSDGVPQWSSVEYWWQFTDEAGNFFETPHYYTEYADTTREWKRAESEDIIVFWEEGVDDEIGELTINAMAEQREFYKKNWPKPLGFKPRAIIYNTIETFREWAPRSGGVTSSGGATTALGGRTDLKWGSTAQIFAPFAEMGLPGNAVDTAYGTVTHEVAHLYQAINGGATVGDFWFFEGNASYFELYRTERYLQNMRQRAEDGNLPSLQGGGPSARGAFARDAYDLGFSFFVWLAETYGDDAHYRLWQHIAAGRGWKEALQLVTSLNFIDMETQFRTWLGAVNPVAPTPVPLPTIFMFPSPTYEPTPGK